MYIISIDRNIALISLNNNKVTLGYRLLVEKANVIIEVLEVDLIKAKCLVIGDASLIKVGMKVAEYSKHPIIKFNEKYIGKVVDPTMKIIMDESTNTPTSKKLDKAKEEKTEEESQENVKTHNYERDEDGNIIINSKGTAFAVNEIDSGITAQHTGIKVIDFFVPYVHGCKTGIIGGAGVGKSTILMEIIRRLKDKDKDYCTVFAGVGERIREGYDLYYDFVKSKLIDLEKPHESNIAIVFGNMDQCSAIRYQAAITGISIAEYFRNQGKNTLFLIDNIYRFIQAGNEISTSMNTQPLELGYQYDLFSSISALQERINSIYNLGSITSLQSIYVPADDITDPAVIACLRHLDSIIILDRKLASQGIHPAVNILSSRSSAINVNIVGKLHYDLHQKAMKILFRYSELENIINIVGIDNLSISDQQTVQRAKLIYMYITQPFIVSERFTGLGPETVYKEDLLNDMQAIISGKLDHIDPLNIYMKGTIKDFI